MLIKQEDHLLTETERISNSHLSVTTLDDVYFYLNISKKRADSDISPRTTSTDTKYSDVHRQSKERSLSCVTTICPQSPIRSDENILNEADIFNGVSNQTSNFWGYMTILTEKITKVFWSIVSLDGDKPLYDYSTPLPEILSHKDIESDIIHRRSYLSADKNLYDSSNANVATELFE